MDAHSARVHSNGGPVEIEFVIGNGVVGDWTLRLDDETGGKRTWTGKNTDRLPDTVSLPAGALAEGDVSLTFLMVLFGPASEVEYATRVRVRQDGHTVLDDEIKHAGTVPARRTIALSGTIAFEEAPA